MSQESDQSSFPIETSSQSTTPVLRPKPHNDFTDIVERTHPTKVDESAATLELRLQKEADGRNEDRFYAYAIGTILLDMAMFQHLPVVGILCVFVLEIVILLGLARRLGNEHVTILLDFLFRKLCERIGLWK
jgi:hypothetical protein